MPETNTTQNVVAAVEVITVPKVGFWGSFKSWMSGISQHIWAAFFPFLKTQAASFIADSWPIFLAGIKAANSAPNASAAEKRKIAEDYIISQLKPLGKTYTTSMLNAGIEIAYSTIKEETGVNVKPLVDAVVDATKKG